MTSRLLFYGKVFLWGCALFILPIFIDAARAEQGYVWGQEAPILMTGNPQAPKQYVFIWSTTKCKTCGAFFKKHIETHLIAAGHGDENIHLTMVQYEEGTDSIELIMKMRCSGFARYELMMYGVLRSSVSVEQIENNPYYKSLSYEELCPDRKKARATIHEYLYSMAQRFEVSKLPLLYENGKLVNAITAAPAAAN